jgi:membrane protease YdiL (CAAX protease family)
VSTEPSRAATREAMRLFRAALFILPALTLGLTLGTGSTVRDGIFVAVLLGTLPLLSMAQVPLLDRTGIQRLAAYKGSITTLTVLGVAALVFGGVGPGFDAMGLSWTLDAQALWTTVGLAAGIALLGVTFSMGGEVLGLEESDLLTELIPRTGREKRSFALLSLAAGVFEEVVYRGYLIAVLAPIFSGPWSAALASSLAFSLLHAYQGPVGIVRSGLMGFLFAAAFILYGSLWPLIAVHVAVDLFSGLILGPRMLPREEIP